MEDLHLTPELMHALFKQELPPAVFANLVLNHLLALCPTCQTAMEVTFKGGRTEYRFDRAFAAAQRAVDQQRVAKSEEARQARRDLTEILRTAPDARDTRVKRASSRFRSPLLVDLLIEESRSTVHDSPEEALHLVGLARVVAERITTAPRATESRVRAAAHQGNAFRILGEFGPAESSFADARRLLEREMVADTLAHAEVARLEGSLRIDQRRFPEAETLLSRAILLYRLARETRSLAVTLMKLAHLHHLRDEPSAAIEVNLEALRVLDREGEPQLYKWARHNLANFLCDIEDFAEARRVLAQVPTRGEGLTTRARRWWLEGRIARGLEELGQAEDLFKNACRSFRELNLPLHVGICVVDLAELYLAEGRTHELMALAEDLNPILSMPELHAEASKALLLFQNAALQQLLSVQLLKQVRTRLEHLQKSQNRLPGVC